MKHEHIRVLFCCLFSTSVFAVPFIQGGMGYAHFKSQVANVSVSPVQGYRFGLGYRMNSEDWPIEYLLSYESYEWNIDSNIGDIYARILGFSVTYDWRFINFSVGVSQMDRIVQTDSAKVIPRLSGRSSGAFLEVLPHVNIGSYLQLYVNLRAARYLEGTSLLSALIGLKVYIDDLPCQP